MFTVTFVPGAAQLKGTVSVRHADKEVLTWGGAAKSTSSGVKFDGQEKTIEVCILGDDGNDSAILVELPQDEVEATHNISLSDNADPLFDIVIKREPADAAPAPHTADATPAAKPTPAPPAKEKKATEPVKESKPKQAAPPAPPPPPPPSQSKPAIKVTVDVHRLSGLSGAAKKLVVKVCKGRFCVASATYDVGGTSVECEPPLQAVLKFSAAGQCDAVLSFESEGCASTSIRLRPWLDQLIDGEPKQITASPTAASGSTLAAACTLLIEGAHHRREVPEVKEMVYDEAFHKACANCGLTPGSLEPKPLEHFKQDGAAEEVALHRFQQHQITLIKQLHMVVKERQRLLQQARKASQRASETSQDGRSSPRSDCSENDKLIERAKRQRQIWDVSAERLKIAKEKRLADTEAIVKRAEEFALNSQKQREEHHAQMVELHRANQEQMRKRWMRDEQLAQQRQARIYEDVNKREEGWGTRIETVNKARQRRNQVLTETAGVSTDENTQARLEKAKELRRKVDEDIAEKTRTTLSQVEQRREKHVYDKFLKQIDLANKALTERETIEATLQRSQQLRESQLRSTSARLEEAAARSAAVVSRNREETYTTVSQKAQQRESKHAIARENRVRSAQRKEQMRIEREYRHQQQLAERDERLAIDEAKRHETAEALERHHKLVINRVTKQQHATVEEQRARMLKRQESVEERMKKMAEIRSLLK